MVLTARHTVRPDTPWAKDDVTGRNQSSIYVVIRETNGVLRDRRSAYVQHENEQYDVASLKIDGSVPTFALDTCPEVVLPNITSLIVLGFPARINGELDQSEGDTLEGGEGVLFEPKPQDNGLVVSAPTRPGFSGAPVFVQGKLIGLVTSGTDGRLAISAETMFAPLSVLRGEFLSSCTSMSCSHRVEIYNQMQDWSSVSGWEQRDQGSKDFCELQRLSRQRQFPERKVTFLSVRTELQWVGVLERKQEFRYICEFRDEWRPAYKDTLTQNCDGLEERAALPR